MCPTSNAITRMPITVDIASHGHGGFCLNLCHEQILVKNPFQIHCSEFNSTDTAKEISFNKIDRD